MLVVEARIISLYLMGLTHIGPDFIFNVKFESEILSKS